MSERDLPSLETIYCGWSLFHACQTVRFESNSKQIIAYSDLPQLRSIQLDTGAFEGNARGDRKTISYPPYNLKNVLSMKSCHSILDTHQTDLPSLTSFKSHHDSYWNFRYFGTVILESMFTLCMSMRYPQSQFFRNLLPVQSNR